MNTRHTDSDFTTFVCLFGILLNYRFGTSENEEVDIDSIAKLSINCLPVVLETWRNYSSQVGPRSTQQQRRVA